MDSEIQEKIEMYVRGELNDEEVDELWILFLRSPEWYDYFNTYFNQMALVGKGYNIKSNSHGLLHNPIRANLLIYKFIISPL